MTPALSMHLVSHKPHSADHTGKIINYVILKVVDALLGNVGSAIIASLANDDIDFFLTIL